MSGELYITMESVHLQLQSHRWSIVTNDNLVYGPVSWGYGPMDRNVIPAEDRRGVFDIINATPDGDHMGQIIITDATGTKYTICAGDHHAYCTDDVNGEWNPRAGRVLSVIDDKITIYSKIPIMPAEYPIYVSAEYLRSISQDYVSDIYDRGDRDITIFHAGFPDAAPIITSYDQFTLIADTTTTFSDGSHTARTAATLSDSDVEVFAKFMRSIGSIKPSDLVPVCDISPALAQMMVEFGITYDTENRVRIS